MIIKKVDIWHLNCRFRYPFKHKLATHTGSNNMMWMAKVFFQTFLTHFFNEYFPYMYEIGILHFK